jgi:hypothetical protein
MGLDSSSICKVCKGKKADVKGYHFKYVNAKERVIMNNEEILEADDTILSNEDWEQLMTSINNPPEANEKLKSLLGMKSTLDG